MLQVAKIDIHHLGQACGSGVQEDQDHLGLCSGYSDLLQDLTSDTELVEFYTLVTSSDGDEEDKGLGLVGISLFGLASVIAVYSGGSGSRA